MRPRDVVELVVLAALWGASFLFMRIAAPAFGPAALAFVRVAGAALFLVPLLALRAELGALVANWRTIAIVGLMNSALPFLCFSYAALSITTGLAAILNSATPLFAAMLAWLWLGERMTAVRIAGLFIGFAGVVWIGWGSADFKPGGSAWAIGACLVATMSYAVAPNLTKRRLAGVAPLAVAAGSQLAAAVLLAGPAALTWPVATPPVGDWLAAALLALLCTGIAYILYFRLIANAGATNAVAVTFLIPPFAILWGGVFLGERPSVSTIAACVVIFVGTALTTGIVKQRLARGALTADEAVARR
ncbi:MAG: DMT family transporter [Rhizobacter sp.]|nr:DMT family transporter [Rhizobacter sp.]